MDRVPTDYFTRARVYRASAVKARARGDETTAQRCEEFAVRCDERAQLFSSRSDHVLVAGGASKASD